MNMARAEKGARGRVAHNEVRKAGRWQITHNLADVKGLNFILKSMGNHSKVLNKGVTIFLQTNLNTVKFLLGLS